MILIIFNGNTISSNYALPEYGNLELSVLVDKSSIEIFVNNGELVLTVAEAPFIGALEISRLNIE